MKRACVAINGFGRIGRLFLRAALKSNVFDVVAINDLGDVENLAYLFKYDTVYGRFPEKVEVKDGSIAIDGKKIQCLQIKDPTQLPWKKLKVDIVVESESGGCLVKSRFLKNPNPDFLQKEMQCVYDNTKDFNTAAQDTSKCSGPLYDLMFGNNPTQINPGESIKINL